MKKLCLLPVLLLLLYGCGRTLPEETVSQASASSEAVEFSSEERYVRIDIYAINDLHGRILDTGTQPGIEALSTCLREARETENAIFLATGDMWQGTAGSALTRGALVTEWMNEMGFAAMTLGGHEYDWGEDRIRENAALADFPFLALNIYDRETDTLADYCQSSLLLEMEGVQIGIIGAIGDCYGSISSQHTGGVRFKTGAELTALVKAESESLRSRGADFIIYTLHDGHSVTTGDTEAMSVSTEALSGYYDTVLSEGYVDMVFEADSHYRYVLEDDKGIYHLQAGGNNKGLSHGAVILDKETGDHHVICAELIPASGYQYLPKDPAITALLEGYAHIIAPADRVLGTVPYRSGNALCDLVAKLYCNTGVEAWGEYDIVLGGGYLSCRSPGYLEAGEVTFGQLQSLFPFDNRIMLCSIWGRDLQSRFLETENEAYHIYTTAYGDSLRGHIDPDGIYYLVTDSYTAEYAYNNLTIIEVYDETTFARDLLADYIEAGHLQ